MKIISNVVAMVLFLNLVFVSFGIKVEAAVLPNNDQLVMDDTENIIYGLSEVHMWSNDEGNNWRQGREGTKFLGDQTVLVSYYDDQIVRATAWVARAYAGGAFVIYNGALWTNVWWAEPGDIPGNSQVPGDNPWQLVKYVPEPISTFTFTRFTGQEAVNFQQREAQRIQNEKKVVGYFANWHGYKTDYQPNNPDYNYSQGIIDGKGFDPVNAPYDLITHINYAFIIIDEDGHFVSNDAWADYDDTKPGGGKNYINQVVNLARDNGVYSMVSIGGWNNSVYDGGFDIITETPEIMNRFTDEVLDFVIEFGFDGVDVDWEYPENNDQKEKFVALIKQLREKLTEAGMQRDIYYQLTIAVTANHEKMQFIDPVTVNAYVDSFNVMTYDFRGGFDTQTGHHSPLYASATDTDRKFNIDGAMQEYANVYNIPKNKLLVGMSNYSRGFANVEEGIIGAPSFGTPIGGTWDDPEIPAGLKTWFQLKPFEAEAKNEGNTTLFYNWDNDAKAPFIYDSEKKEFYTYDNVLSTSYKVNYTINNDFGGSIIWELAFDTPETYELTTLVNRVLTGDIIDIEEDGNTFLELFTDRNLAEAVANALQKEPTEPVTIEELAQIKNLSAPNKNIISLEGMQYLTGLITLNLDNNKINDIEPLRGLTELKELYLNVNLVTNLEPLRQLISLERLALNDNGLNSDNLQAISSLVNLQYLYLNTNNIDVLNNLVPLKRLAYLALNNNQISDLMPLMELYNTKTAILAEGQYINLPDTDSTRTYFAIRSTTGDRPTNVLFNPAGGTYNDFEKYIQWAGTGQNSLSWTYYDNQVSFEGIINQFVR